MTVIGSIEYIVDKGIILYAYSSNYITIFCYVYILYEYVILLIVMRGSYDTYCGIETPRD
jgi:hypothetical protein